MRRLQHRETQLNNLLGVQEKLDRRSARSEQLYKENTERLDDSLKGLHDARATKEGISMDSLISGIGRGARIDRGWIEGSSSRSEDSANV